MTFSIGPMIDFFHTIFYASLVAGGDVMFVRVLVMVVGAIIFAIGVGFYIATEFGIGGLEFILLTVTEKTGFKMKYVKIAQDALFVIIGFFMGGIVGVGTIIGVFATGPIIDVTLKFIKNPVSRFVGPLRLPQT